MAKRKNEPRLLRERLLAVVPHQNDERGTYSYVEAIYEDFMYDGSIRMRTEVRYDHDMSSDEARLLSIAAMALLPFRRWAEGMIQKGDPIDES